MHVIVVGAGVIGTTTAWFLQEAGVTVTLIDSSQRPASGTSAANGGMLHVSHAEPWNAPGVGRTLIRYLGREESPLLLRPSALPGLGRWGLEFLWNSRRERFAFNTRWNGALAAYSLQELRKLQQKVELDFAYRASGILKIFRDNHSLLQQRQASQLLVESGTHFEDWSIDRILEEEPLLKTIRAQIVGGIFFPGDAVGDAALFTRALADAAILRGLRWYPGITVTGFRTFRGQINGIETSEGPMAADAVVLAAGHSVGKLTHPLGLSPAVAPVKGYSLTLELPEQHQLRIPLIDDANKVVLTPLGNRLRIAGTAEFAGTDLRIRAVRTANVLKQCRKTLPHLPEEVSEARMQPWAGLRPMAARGRPILGPTPIPGLYLNTGAGHLGWTLSCGAASLLRDSILGNPSPLPITPFLP